MKRCQVCSEQYDASDPGDLDCVVAFLGRHVPTDRPGTIYILHFDSPTHVSEADNACVQPTTHYVGWTGQPVEQRAEQHGALASSIAAQRPGTAEDEKRVKREESCPRCGVSLAPECLVRQP